ncbi:HCP-like protein [Hesseltinella vesiculosa]|uniref:HCP-like protein n=1 Tax=Hesseltinella vesiculosa TaxID=101127 RepID=A0A1X2GSF9_9FUNG|nr:HCP-like protein [Hesseltinella vesiculosa]
MGAQQSQVSKSHKPRPRAAKAPLRSLVKTSTVAKQPASHIDPFSFAEPVTTLNDYLHQTTVIQRVDDLHDVPFIDEVHSTISESSQFSALFSTLSSISPSSVSSIESHLDKLSIQPPQTAQKPVNRLSLDKTRPSVLDDLLAIASDSIEMAYAMAVAFYHGVNELPPDVTKATHWFEKAASLGSSDMPLNAMAHYRCGQLLLAQFYHHHLQKTDQESVAALETKAWMHLHKAATHGHARASFFLGCRAQESNDPALAFTWFLAAWRHGLVHAETALAGLLMTLDDHDFDLLDIDLRQLSISGASGFSRDQLVLHLLQDAAQKNDLTATLQLGSMCSQQDERRDPDQALVWFDKASTLIDEDHPRVAMHHYLLGREYWLLFGRQPFDSSVRWHDHGRRRHHHQLAWQHFSKAAHLGYAPAQRALGHLYYTDTHTDLIVRQRHQHKAHVLFLDAADQGDVSAIGFLGEQFQHGHGCDANQDMAIHYFQLATQAGSAVAQLSLGLLFHEQGLYDQALPHFLALSARSSPRTTLDILEQDVFMIHARAKFMIACYRQKGCGGLPLDPFQAFQDLHQLADHDQFSSAYHPLALCYKYGVRVTHPPEQAEFAVPPNLALAIVYFEKAATLDNSLDAQLTLASMCASGYDYRTPDGQTQRKGKDRPRAFYYYSLATKSHHHPEAQYCLGIYYAKGLAPLTSRDLVTARQLYEASAQQGYALAMVQLAQLLVQEKNYKLAQHWLQLAVDQNQPSAYRELALLFERSSDNPQYEKAWQLLSQAIDHKDVQAWCAKARFFENGWHVQQDLKQALTCLEKAESLGYVKAGLLLGECHERNGHRDLALEKYNALIKIHPLRSQLGWYARLNKSRILVMDIDASQNKPKPEPLTRSQDHDQVFLWLKDMSEQQLCKDAIEPLYLLGMCLELGVGTSSNLSKAKATYEMACSVTLDEDDISWSQQSTRLRLAILCTNQQQHRQALAHLTSLEPFLQRMNHHSPETCLQARLARYYFGYLLLLSDGQERDEAAGLAWLQQAADQGEGRASYELGRWAVQQGDINKAMDHFDNGVSAGNPGCMRERAILLQQAHKDGLKWEGAVAFDLLKQAHERGDLDATVQMALIIQHGLGSNVPKGDLMEALGFYIQAAQHGHALAAIYSAMVLHELGNHIVASEWFRIQRDHLMSRVWMAHYRLKGLGGMKKEPQLAFKDLISIADASTGQDPSKPVDSLNEQATSLALLMTGRCYEEGEGTEPNEVHAMRYYALARERTQDVVATYRLGKLFFDTGDPQCQIRAFECFDEAASRGHLEARYMVGVYHARGLGGMRRDKQTAIVHLKRAISDENPRAHLELGHVLWAARQWDDAMQHFIKAADLNIPEAAYHLGSVYHTGKKRRNGLVIAPRDNNKAFMYFAKAADLGHAQATLMVGTYYQEGYDAAFHPVDLTKAEHYYQLARQRFEDQTDTDPQTRRILLTLDLAMAKLAYTLANHLADADPEASLQHHQRAFDLFRRLCPLYHRNSGISSRRPSVDLDEMQPPWHDDQEDDDEPSWYDAQLMVGFYYLHGWGPVEQDPQQGFQLIKDAAVNGDHAEALLALARCYENGLGTANDSALAFDYWREAASLGSTEAIDQVILYLRRHNQEDSANDDIALHWEQQKDALLRERHATDDTSSIYTTTSTSSSSN